MVLDVVEELGLVSEQLLHSEIEKWNTKQNKETRIYKTFMTEAEKHFELVSYADMVNLKNSFDIARQSFEENLEGFKTEVLQ
jgi:hypothetical protein